MQAERAYLVLPSPVPDAIRAHPPVHVGVYEGPLDLLLFLVRREGVALREIPVARICAAYLEHLHGLDDIDVDSAGEYLAMASTLCLLKARELLPRSADSGREVVEEDSRAALERRLVEYERFRDAADQLGRRQVLNRDVFPRRAAPPSADEQPIDPVTDTWGLATLFYGLLERRAAPPPHHTVALEKYTMADTVRAVLQRLDDGEEHQLSELWANLPMRRARLLTFLAVLETARFQLIDVSQRVHLGAVTLRSFGPSDKADLSMFKSHEHDDPRADP